MSEAGCVVIVVNTETMLPAEPQLRQAPQASPTSCWLLLCPFYLQGHKTRRAWKEIVKDAAVPTCAVLVSALDGFHVSSC